jgi:O-antigen/teichoic acid export membrane protein
MEKFRAITSKALRFVMLMATPMVIYFMLFASSGIRLLSGNGYDGAIVPMILIMPTLLFIGMSNITGLQILVPTGREKLVLYSTIAGAVIDVIINAVLIPSMASSGAAIGTLVAELLVLLIQCWFLKEELRPIFRAMEFKKFLPALGLAVLASAWTIPVTFAQGTLGAFLKLLVSAALYFSVYLGSLLITREPLVVDIVFTTLGNLKKRFFRQRG